MSFQGAQLLLGDSATPKAGLGRLVSHHKRGDIWQLQQVLESPCQAKRPVSQRNEGRMWPEGAEMKGPSPLFKSDLVPPAPIKAQFHFMRTGLSPSPRTWLDSESGTWLGGQKRHNQDPIYATRGNSAATTADMHLTVSMGPRRESCRDDASSPPTSLQAAGETPGVSSYHPHPQDSAHPGQRLQERQSPQS